MLSRTFGLSVGSVGNIAKSSVVCTLHLVAVRRIKPRGMRWAGYAARMGEKRNA